MCRSFRFSIFAIAVCITSLLTAFPVARRLPASARAGAVRATARLAEAPEARRWQPGVAREVAITFDDLPTAGVVPRDIAASRELTRELLAAAYVPYMQATVEFFERNSRELFDREMRQILLVHANMLNAGRFDELASMLERRGYRFITLERALEDPAFASSDTFVGSSGISWMHRWALTRKMPKSFYAGEPEVPGFVAEMAKP
jgi:hypothetical protein